MYTIVGLRNAKDTYSTTRHNVGERVVRFFQHQYGLPEFVSSAHYAGDISEGVVEGTELRLVLPNTFMNESGGAVRKTEDVTKLVLVYDDLDLPIGSFKISTGGGSAGHNGVASVIDALGSKEFVRVRIGISPLSFFGNMKRPKGERVPKFVLQKFGSREVAKLEHIMPDVADALALIVTKGAAAAMNAHN